MYSFKTYTGYNRVKSKCCLGNNSFVLPGSQQCRTQAEKILASIKNLESKNPY